jgi:outer membrane receptor for ferric coprogen and ferric-rhodotorulic acid
MDDALQAIARQCNLQMAYFSGITAGVTAPDLQGTYSVDDALTRLLDGSGLSFHHVNDQTIQIERAAGEPRGRLAGTVGRSGARRLSLPETASEVPEVVVNATAEGLVATRIETPLRDIPQSISVASAEQIRQQNNFDFGETLDDAVGITSFRIDSLYEKFYSRGFLLSNYTLDGGGSLQPLIHVSQLSFGDIMLVPNLAGVDHVEILRGSNALFGADAQPAGAINLIRKRPLDFSQVVFSSSVGSWNNYRQEVDATGPLGLDGALRGRLDLSYGHREYFYSLAHDEPTSVFGVLDYDVTASTVLTLGGSYTRDRSLPFERGLPRLSNVEDPQLPRDTAYTFEWSFFNTRIRDAYVRLDQALGSSWRLRLNATSLYQGIEFAIAQFGTAINATTGGIPTGPSASYTAGPTAQKQFNLEATLTGNAQWLGFHEDLVIGADFRRSRADLLLGQTAAFGPPLESAYEFDPANYPDPRNGPTAGLSFQQAATNILSGLFASMRVELSQSGSVTAGLRVSNERFRNDRIRYYSPQLQIPNTLHYEINGTLTPFVATQWALSDTYSLYASYADIYLDNGGLQLTDKSAVRPTEGATWESGVKGAWRDGSLNGSLVLYKTIERGLAEFDPSMPASGYCCYAPTGREVSKGVDVELSGELGRGSFVGAGYSYNTNGQEVPDLGRISSWTPRHLLKVWTSFALPGRWSRWNVGGTLHAQSSIFAQTYSCALENPQGRCLTGYQNALIVQKSYVVVSPRIAYEIDRHWQLALTANNVLDRRYFQTLGSASGGSWYGEPRNFLIRLDGRY